MITKGAIRDFRGIVLVEVIWETVTSLLNRRLATSIKLHDVLHGFWEGYRMGAATF